MYHLYRTEYKSKNKRKNTNIVDDLGADSLDVFQIIMGIEEEFDIEIPAEGAEKIATVEEAVNLIKNALN